MSIKPWVFEFFHSIHDPDRRDDPAAVAEHFRKYFDLWVDDEKLGWEGILFSEHHFGPGYSPSPNLVIANLAARTSTLRLGALGTVSPYATPWRVVEEYAMLDHLTGGRVEIGVVSGIPPEIAVVGITPQQAAEVHNEVVEVLLATVAKPTVSHQGKHFSFDSVRITPGFLQENPAVWTAARSAGSARKAGERGMKMCSGFLSAEDLTPVYDAYREGAKSAGKPTGADQLGIRRAISIAADDGAVDDARASAADGFAEFMKASMEAMNSPDAPTPKFDPADLIAGTPQQVADEIIRQCTVLGAGHFLATFNIFDHDELRKQHELFGREVIPRLRAAEIG